MLLIPLDCVIVLGGGRPEVSIICPIIDINGPAPTIPLIEDFPFYSRGTVLAWHGGRLIACGGHGMVVTGTRDTCWKLDWVS